MDNIVEVVEQFPGRTIHPEDFVEDVCEHCLGGVFKEGVSQGECHIGPPMAGMVLVPSSVPPTPSNPNGIQMSMQPYSLFPPVERRTRCMAFEPKDSSVTH